MTSHDSPDTANQTETIWSRGGLWVIAQFPLGGLAMLAARIGPELPDSLIQPARWLGAILSGAGGVLILTGLLRLGRNLTPFPKPLAGSQLATTGAYGVVRHPIYGGAVLGMFGWALLNGRWAGLLAALLLGIFFDQKSKREERWLSKQFADYAAYQRRVRKLIPWLY